MNHNGESISPELFSDSQAPRLWGIYPQQQDDLYMQRVKVSAGRLSPAQLRSLAEVAHQFSGDSPLHLTTRQDIELHGVRFEDVRRVQKKITRSGLTCTGACGNSVRNITVCPGAGICPGSRDVAPVAESVREALEKLPYIRHLPRKFKISFSGCEKCCGLPFLNDVGFVLQSDGTYTLLGAGSIGSPPRTAMMLSSCLLSAEGVAAVAAATRLFNRLGDRENRHKARLRHVRERLGDEAFKSLFTEEFHLALKAADETPTILASPRNGYSQITCLRFPFGNISPKQAYALAGAVEQAEGQIRIDLEHGVWLVTKKALHLPAELNALTASPHITCCPGSTFCASALVDCRKTATHIAEKLVKSTGLSIKISGCPHNCSHAAVADIGLIGRVRNIDGARYECFKLVAGGGGGKTAELAIPLASAIPSEQASDVVNRLLEEYSSPSERASSFAQFIHLEQDGLKNSIVREFLSEVHKPSRSVGR
jgi:sulfite reductase (ferredoxin)